VMTRDEALAFLGKHLKTPNLLKHSLACEAVMRALARFFGEDEEEWALAGLLHDLDYEETKDAPTLHGILSAQYLEEVGFSPCLVDAVRSHNELTGFAPNGKMAVALFAVDPTSGFIIACVLVHRDRSLQALQVPFLLSRFKEKGFARGASREQIKKCSLLRLSVEEFLTIALQAMQHIAPQLEL